MCVDAPRYSEELKEILSHQIMGVKILTQDSSISFKMEDAFEIACKLVSNTFSLLNWEMNTIGSGVYLMPSLFNHSCNPNVIAIFDGFNLKLRTIRPVESGHQLFVSYVDLLETRERRCRHLQKYYLFTCACGRCSENYDESIDQQMVATSSSLSDEIQCKELYREGFKTIEDVQKLKKSNDWDSILDITTKFLKNHSSALGDYNVLIVKMREILMDSYIEFSEWSKSLDVARALIGPYEKYYHHYNPVIGLHYCKMAKLIQQISEDTPNLMESMTFFDKAVGILNVAFGASNPIVMETQGAMNDTGMELAKRSCNKQHR
jgi:SET and MYND domain-containing protein